MTTGHKSDANHLQPDSDLVVISLSDVNTEEPSRVDIRHVDVNRVEDN